MLPFSHTRFTTVNRYPALPTRTRHSEHTTKLRSPTNAHVFVFLYLLLHFMLLFIRISNEKPVWLITLVWRFDVTLEAPLYNLCNVGKLLNAVCSKRRQWRRRTVFLLGGGPYCDRRRTPRPVGLEKIRTRKNTRIERSYYNLRKKNNNNNTTTTTRITTTLGYASLPTNILQESTTRF